MSIQLYQFETCLLSAKVRAVLEFKNLAYERIEVDPFTYREIAFSQDWDQIPILVDQGEPVFGENTIIEHIESKYPTREYSLIRPGKEGTQDREAWKWVDEEFLIFLSPNLYGSWRWSWGTFFHHRDQIRSKPFRWFGPVLLWMSSRRKMKRLGLTGSSQARDFLQMRLNEWEDRFGQSPFMGGDSPRIADVLLYGVMRTLQPTPLGREIMQGKFLAWFERMVGILEQSPSNQGLRREVPQSRSNSTRVAPEPP